VRRYSVAPCSSALWLCWPNCERSTTCQGYGSGGRSTSRGGVERRLWCRLPARIQVSGDHRRWLSHCFKSLNSTETCAHHNLRMRLFWIIAIIMLFGVDRIFLDGQVADHVWSLVVSIGTSLKYWAQDLLQPFPR
jgi:hypothetical protein